METFAPATLESAEPIEGVHLTPVATGEEMSAHWFDIEPGAVVPEHDHPHEQFGFVHQGELTFAVGGERIVVSAGQGFAIPGGEPHRAENTGDSSVYGMDVFAPPREFEYWSE